MKSIPWTPAVFLVAVGTVGGWSLHHLLAGAGDGAEAAEAAVSPADMAVQVATAPVAVGAFAVTVEAFGVVRLLPAAAWTITSRAGGQVTAAPVPPGTRVAAGQLLVAFDRAAPTAIVAQMHAEVERAAGELSAFDQVGRATRLADLEVAAARATMTAELADAQAGRLEGLRGDGLVAERTSLEARREAGQRALEREAEQRALAHYRTTGADLARAQLVAALDAAKARLLDAEAILAQTDVKAPAAGVLDELTVRPGDSPAAGAVLGALILDEGRRIELAVAADLVGRVVPGAIVSWHGPEGDQAGPSERTGTIEAVASRADPATGMVSVFARSTQASPTLLPGTRVSAEIETEHLARVPLVPDHAVLRSGERQVVVVAGADGLTHSVPVRVRGRHAGVTAVEGALAEGDRVIIDGGYNLPEGARVVPKPPAPASGDGH